MTDFLLDCPRLQTTLHSKDGTFQLIADGFQLKSGERAVLAGSSGSGKSLFLELIALVREPDKPCTFRMTTQKETLKLGALWRGRHGPDQLARLRRESFGFVPQTGDLLPFLNVRENIVLSQQFAGFEDPLWIDYLLDRLNLSDTSGSQIGALSIGQRQRVAIGRALAHKPQLILADEPTAPLDRSLSEVTVDLISELSNEAGSAVILATHDTDLISLGSYTKWTCQQENGATHITLADQHVDPIEAVVMP